VVAPVLAPTLALALAPALALVLVPGLALVLEALRAFPRVPCAWRP